jgi:glycosyltransferase involved in cell wall biosynthesis
MRDQALTIVVPTYNHQRYIRDAVMSVRRQTIFSDCRVLVSDDCSTDHTFELAKAAGNATHIVVQRTLENLGTMPHYQQLIERVETPFTAFLEGDDVWLTNRRLELMRELLIRNARMGMCFSACIADFESTGERRHLPWWNDGRNRIITIIDLINDNPIATFSNCLYRTEYLRNAFTAHGVGFDWLCHMKIALETDIGFFAEPSTLYRVHSAGQWSKLPARDREMLIRESLQALLQSAPADLHQFIEAAIGKQHER